MGDEYLLPSLIDALSPIFSLSLVSIELKLHRKIPFLSSFTVINSNRSSLTEGSTVEPSNNSNLIRHHLPTERNPSHNKLNHPNIIRLHFPKCVKILLIKTSFFPVTGRL
jgi:hypothetical protein